jgi:hypothetical protein
MDWLQHLHNDHGELAFASFLFSAGAVLWSFFCGFFRGLKRSFLARLPVPRWYVRHQKVTPPFFNPRVEIAIYGPYHWKLLALMKAHSVLGSWDLCEVKDFDSPPPGAP